MQWRTAMLADLCFGQAPLGALRAFDVGVLAGFHVAHGHQGNECNQRAADQGKNEPAKTGSSSGRGTHSNANREHEPADEEHIECCL